MAKYLGNNLGASGDPVAEVHADSIKRGGQEVVATNDARLPTSDEKAACAGSNGSPSASNRFITQTDRTRLFWNPSLVGLTGGGATKLDGVSTTGIDISGTPYVLAVLDDNGGSPVLRFYELEAGTTAESSPTTIRPDDYAAVSNEKIWSLRDALGGHGSGHELGGADEVNGDQIGIDFTPSNYTPDDTAPEAGEVDHLAAHLAGIDNVLANVLTSRTGVYREMTVPPTDMTVDNAAAPTEGAVDFGTLNLKCFTFADAASKAVFAVVHLPSEWKTDTSPRFRLILAASTTGDARIEVSAIAGDFDVDLTAALGAAHAFTHSIATADAMEKTSPFTLSPAGDATGNVWILRIQRTGADAADNLAGSLYLLGLQAQWMEDAAVPSVWS